MAPARAHSKRRRGERAAREPNSRRAADQRGKQSASTRRTYGMGGVRDKHMGLSAASWLQFSLSFRITSRTRGSGAPPLPQRLRLAKQESMFAVGCVCVSTYDERHELD
eukprot:scaffold9836_cov26-Tisochrysis_lutea.AAC.5